MNSLWPTSEKITTLFESIIHKPQLLQTFQCSWPACLLSRSLHSTTHMAISLLTREPWNHTEKALCGGWSGNTAVPLQLRASSSRHGLLDSAPDQQSPSKGIKALFKAWESHWLALEGVWALEIGVEPAMYAVAIQGIKSYSHRDYVELKTKKWPCNPMALHSTW